MYSFIFPLSHTITTDNYFYLDILKLQPEIVTHL